MKIALAPIALFVYNRPKHTRETIEALLGNAESEHSDLFIFSDAAKHKSTESAVNEVRDFINKITGFNKVTIIERDANLGLAKSVIDGVTKLCNEYGRVIVLEDDLRVSPHFLHFMNASLDRFENDERVMQIAGYMFPVKLTFNEDALFLPLTSSWGWATWQRAWQHFDSTASGYLTLANNKQLKRAFNLNGRYAYFQMLQAQISNEVDSWAIRWYLSVFLKKGLVLYPKTTMVENSGFDGTGVNCAASEFESTPIDQNFKILTFPLSSEISPIFNELIRQLPKPKFNLKTYITRLIKKIKA
jgi:hypothetical protein